MALFNTPKRGLLSFLKPKSQGSFEDVAKKKEERRAQGLAVSTRKDRYEPTTGGGLLRGVLKLPARAALNVAGAGAGLLGIKSVLSGNKRGVDIANKVNTTIDKGVKTGYFGELNAIGSGRNRKTGERYDMWSDPMRSFKDSVGAGLEAASYIPVARGAKLGIEGVKAGAKGLLRRAATKAIPLAREGAAQGLLSGAGTAMQEDKSARDIAKDAAFGAVTGAVAAPALGLAGAGAGYVAGRAGKVAKEGIDLYSSMTPAQRQAGYITIPEFNEPKNVFRGEKGKGVINEQYKPGKTIDVENDQQQLIREIANEGDKRAQELVNKYGSRKIDYVEMDPIIRDYFGSDYDSIRYQNKNIPKKGAEYHNLKDNKFYSENKDIAELYSLQNRGAKYEKVKTMSEPKFKLDPEKQEKLDMLKEYKSLIEYQMSEHPGRRLQRFISKKEGQFVDPKDATDMRLTSKERQRIIDRNKKLHRVSESALEGTLKYDMYDNTDTIRESIEGYQKLRDQYQDIQNQIRDIKKPVEIPQEKPKKIRQMTRSREIESLERLASEEASRQQRRQALESTQTVPARVPGAFDTTGNKPIKSGVLEGGRSGTPGGVGKPLQTIIQDMDMPAKGKVNLIDYVSTPEETFKKLGLTREMNFIRKQYEGYQKELRTNIGKITEWADQVDQKSNVRIFQYLDGQKVELNAQEMKIATEVRAWLEQWADRLDLPKVPQSDLFGNLRGRISSYITHIFEPDFIKKDFDEDLAKIIADKIPGQVYDPFLEKRLGKLGYVQDTWRALDAYVKRATRKVHMDPALAQMKDAAEKLDKDSWSYVKQYVDRINMRPTDLDNLLDNFIKDSIGYKFGSRPVTALLQKMRQWVYRGTLGGNIGSALRNLTQGANTYAELGEKYTIKGYMDLIRKGTKELHDEGVLLDNFIQDRQISAYTSVLAKVDKGLFYLFELAEKINRGSAYFGAKARALAQGQTEEQAIEIAKALVRKTQFAFGSIDTPVALQSDIMKSVFQLQTFTVKQTEFLARKIKAKEWAGLVRYAAGNLAMIYTVGQLFGMKPKDMIPSFRLGTPPSIGLPVEIGKAALDTKDKYGNDRDFKQKLGDIGKAALPFVPAGSQIKKTVQGISAVKQGYSESAGGKFQYDVKQTPGSYIRAGLFGKSNTKEAQNYFAKDAINDKASRPIQKVYNQVQKLKEEGRLDEAKALVNGLSDEDYEVYKKIRTQEKSKSTQDATGEMIPTVQKILKLKAEGKTDEALAIVNAMSDEEYRIYKLAKTKIDSKPSKDQLLAQRNAIQLIVPYIRAYFINPKNAAKAMFTKEKLGEVKGNLVELIRFAGKDYKGAGGSEEYIKKELEKMGIPWADRDQYNLEHILPVDAGGGSYDPDNLAVIPRDLHNSYTPFDIALGNAIKNKRIRSRDAIALARRLKIERSIGVQEAIDYLKNL